MISPECLIVNVTPGDIFAGKVLFRRPGLYGIPPAEGQPHVSKGWSLVHRMERELRPAVVGDVVRQLPGVVVIGHERQKSVGDEGRRLAVGVSRADEHVDGGQLVGEAVNARCMVRGGPPEPLLEQPDDGEPKLGEGDGEVEEGVGGRGEGGEAVVEEGEDSGEEDGEVDLVEWAEGGVGSGVEGECLGHVGVQTKLGWIILILAFGYLIYTLII